MQQTTCKFTNFGQQNLKGFKLVNKRYISLRYKNKNLTFKKMVKTSNDFFLI